jgi:hypothetical protein
MFSLINFDSCDQQMMTWQSSGGFCFALLLSGDVSSKPISPKEQLVEAGREQGITTAAPVLVRMVLGISKNILVSSVEVILLPSLATLYSSLSPSADSLWASAGVQ